MSTHGPDQPIDLSEFTEDVARVTGETVGEIAGRTPESADDLLAASRKKEERENREKVIERLPKELQGVLEEYRHCVGRLSWLLERQPGTGALGCKRIDGHFAIMPNMLEVAERLKANETEYLQKVREGFDTLLIVPFGMRLDAMQDKYRLVLDSARSIGGGVFDSEGKPFEIPSNPTKNSAVQDEPIERTKPYYYGTPSMTEQRTKDRILEEESTEAWRVFLVEDPVAKGLIDLPTKEHVAASRTIDQARDWLYPYGAFATRPRVYQDRLQTDRTFRGEQGMDLETYLVLAMRQLEVGRQALDIHSQTVLLGSHYTVETQQNVGILVEPHFITVRFSPNVDGALLLENVGIDDMTFAAARTVVEVR